jgi:LPS export ABC transporter protein LptC
VIRIFNLFLTLILLTQCTVREEKKTEEVKVYPDMEQVNYQHYIYKNGRKYLAASISKAEFFEKKGQINCTQIHAEVFNSKEELSTLITADSGEINRIEKYFIFKGKVAVDSKIKKIKLNTEELKLDYQNNRLICDKEVIITKEDGSYIKSAFMDSDIKTQNTRFDQLELMYYYDNTDDKQ